MPTYDTKYGRITLTPTTKSIEDPAPAVPDELLDPDEIDELDQEVYGAEALLYIFSQHVYARLGRKTQLRLSTLLKKMRPAIIAQVNTVGDGTTKDSYFRLMSKKSPALFPDAPDAPPDVPTSASHINAILQVIAERDGLDTTEVTGDGIIDLSRFAACYGYEAPDRVEEIRRAAFSEGVKLANTLATNIQSVQFGGDFYLGGRDMPYSRRELPEALYDVNPYGPYSTNLQQATAKRTLEPDDDGRSPPPKRARFDGPGAYGPGAYGPGDISGDISESESDSFDSDASLPSDLELDQDMDIFSNPDDAGAGTGMTPAPQAPHATPAATGTTRKADDWEEKWHDLPYESRLHKLGPGMSRQNLVPADEFALPRGSTSVPVTADIYNQVAVYKGKGVPPRFATFAEAMAVAPDDYADYPEAFAWEVQHGRAAPAVLPKDQLLRVVPGFPVMRLPTKEEYDPKVPEGTTYADDTWTNHVSVRDPFTGEVSDVMVMPGVPHNTPERPRPQLAAVRSPTIPISLGPRADGHDGSTVQGSSTNGARGARTGGRTGGKANRLNGQSIRGFLRLPRWRRRSLIFN